MSKKPKTAPTYDAATVYRVEVSRAVRISEHVLLSPRHHEIKVKGSVLETLPADAIISAEAI
ncbi:hypothetical protein ONR75_11225 [Rhodopseudomonas sp. P2A-2r]|uniref:hypothetical protein n=1 Tax=Rhodopseudomonas sp. P2A-2r TaxID=2991972 RepID=UPI002233EBFA|nr:hypothetical protein [Rhodopseudomonas sp. P2A-2r]UZE51128.1 hypothetical protein ONR75_11225 [Rhodopseudomonas sp. P2A-2r]